MRRLQAAFVGIGIMTAAIAAAATSAAPLAPSTANAAQAPAPVSTQPQPGSESNAAAAPQLESGGAAFYTMPDTGYKSMFFSPSEMNAILVAAEQYRINLAKAEEARRAQHPDYLSALQSPANATRVIEHPQYYFSSLIYRAGNDWALWVNDREFTSAQPTNGDLTVLHADKEKAEFAWKPLLFPLYADRYGSGHDAHVELDKPEEQILFSLYPNQTFSAYSMSIEEGWLPPTRREEIIMTPELQKALLAGMPSGTGLNHMPLPTAPLPAVPDYNINGSKKSLSPSALSKLTGSGK